MENVIEPISVVLLEKELKQEYFLRETNKAKNEIYIVDKDSCPNLMMEIGRLREISFRTAGGGTGKSCDIDCFDQKFKQLIVWNPEAKEIIGGYRFALMSDLFEQGKLFSPTEELFSFSQKFMSEYLDFSIELGRSFVIPKYQSKAGGVKSLFALDNLWDGLGSLVSLYPKTKYFCGKMTMYPNYNSQARNIIMMFLRKYFPDNEGLMLPKFTVPELEKSLEDSNEFFKKNNYKEDFKLLLSAVSTFGESVPPLFKQYMDLSPTMLSFGTSLNSHFGSVEETGILVTIKDIYPEKKARYLNVSLNPRFKKSIIAIYNRIKKH